MPTLKMLSSATSDSPAADSAPADTAPADRADNPAASSHVFHPTVKQFADRAFGLLLLILALPVIGVLVLAIRLTSRGPGIYSQVRVGRGGRQFTMYKLRSMRSDAESRLGPTWAAVGSDPRVTPLGRWLRLLHLDELPQLYNLVRGEMSLVGPRPERPEFVSVLAAKIPGYLDRLQVLPGITGLAQINLPADTDLDSVRAKLELDLEYIQTANLLLDLRIALCTMLRLVGLRGGRGVSLLGLSRQVTLAPSVGPTGVIPLPSEQPPAHAVLEVPVLLEPPSPISLGEPCVTNHSVMVASQG
jgi:lipopolysaccharide/colanic/teichoic acid biosynthesis glycosyltransferase